MHAKIASYLSRLTVPEYLHSGIKGRSHITNAKIHLGATPVLTMDIQKFYPSVSKKSIYHFYQKFLGMEPDIAGLLAELCSYNDKLPTGSRLSMPLAYWSNHQMYDALLNYCNSCNVKMSVYVDDLTFSGLNVNRLFKSKVEKIVEDAGLKVHPKKTKLYKAKEPKLITGVVINGETTSVRNKHHKAIYNLFNEMDECKSEAEWTAKHNELVGRLNAAGQVDPLFKQRMQTYKQTTAHLTKGYR